ncbi:MAG: hypothetical protein O3A33_09410 [Chloroflexi bacterium]|nr:hypothetical protein [Chloroflexota bacterium]
MNQHDNIFSEDDIELRSILIIVLRRWWLIVGAVLVVAGGAWMTNPEPSGPTYQSRVRLMLVPSVSEGLLNGVSSSSFASRMSAETLSSLATGNDLLVSIISRLELKDEISGQPWPVQRLSTMLNASVLPDGGGPGFPILTTVVSGVDPSQVKRIADAWLVEFTEQNQQFSVSEAARSHDFLLGQHQLSEAGIQEAIEERQEYQEEYPIALLQQELSLKQDKLREYLDVLLTTSAQLRLERSRYEQAVGRYEELTVDGMWIGMDFNGNNADLIPDQSPEQQAVTQAKEALFRAQDDLQKFEEETNIDIENASLVFQVNRLSGDQLRLGDLERDYEAELARLRQRELEIETLPELLVTVRAIDDQALWQQLGINPTIDDLERVREIGLRTEQVNPVYSTLLSQIIAGRATIEAQQKTISFLQLRIKQTEDEVTTLRSEISNIKDPGLPRLEIRTQLAQRRYDKERENFVSLEDTVIALRNEIDTLEEVESEYMGLVESYETDIRQVASSLPSIKLRYEELDQQIQRLQTTLDDLGTRLRQSEIAMLDENQTNVMLETAVLPQTPLPAAGREINRILIGATVGAVLGVVLAFAWHYIPPQVSAGTKPETS